MKPDIGCNAAAAAGSIREAYERQGADAYYRTSADDYRNPHEPEICDVIRMATERWHLDLSHVLDLAAGTGEATLALRGLGAGRVDGCDPYLFQQYAKRTGQVAERFSFNEIAIGSLEGRSYSLVVCSFALHLAEPSRLAGVCFQLSLITPFFLLLTPHKRPEIKAAWGWRLEGEFVWARVRCRLYDSTLAVPRTDSSLLNQ